MHKARDPIAGKTAYTHTRCPDCKVNLWKENLRAHRAKDCNVAAIKLKKHENMYSCCFCSYGFAEKLSLLEHMRSEHATGVKFRGFPIEKLDEMILALKKAKNDRKANNI